MISLSLPSFLHIILLALLTHPIACAACSTRSGVTITFYGYPDNDPPGPATAYNCGGRNNVAGGNELQLIPHLMSKLC